ncbi:hypothetical protein ABQG55_12025 [Aeromonas dhakensis]|uniref:hypothetical protein n=1 Tax=Aeromonas dhakensis TaxID=196024 RepID=UPI0032EAAA41
MKKATIRSPFSFLSLYSQENSPRRSLGTIAFGRRLATLSGRFGACLAISITKPPAPALSLAFGKVTDKEEFDRVQKMGRL